MPLLARAKRPVRLAVEVWDKDFTNIDDLLCVGTVTLAPELVGTVSQLQLSGRDDFHSCQVTFSYAYTPRPMGRLALNDMVALRTHNLESKDSKGARVRGVAAPDAALRHQLNHANREGSHHAKSRHGGARKNLLG
tara:strand:+ start:6752 stop:7159 length:408 start_codon:yes stop_codon:yes gene_type:complete